MDEHFTEETGFFSNLYIKTNSAISIVIDVITQIARILFFIGLLSISTEATFQALVSLITINFVNTRISIIKLNKKDSNSHRIYKIGNRFIIIIGLGVLLFHIYEKL